MERELKILTEISEYENISQRQLAKSTGLSLGTVNALVQRMVNNGLIKVSQLNPKTVKYILTPQGMKEKAKRTYNYVVASYKMISKVKMNIKRIIEHEVARGVRMFYLFGKEDEVYKLVKMSLIEAKRRYELEYIKIDDINNMDINNNYIIMVWETDILEEQNDVVNVLYN